MPDPNVNIIIDELKSELKSKYPDFQGIYLFGSRARGDYNDMVKFEVSIIEGYYRDELNFVDIIEKLIND
jgi:predicted nucleotidyltransferase